MNFSQPKIESPDILVLQERIAQLEAQLRKDSKEKPILQPERVKQEISNYIQEVQQTPSFALPTSTRDEVDEIKKFSPSQQVGSLVSLTLSDGLQKAVALANDLGNPAIVDELHDTLVDNYFAQLVQRGVIRLL